MRGSEYDQQYDEVEEPQEPEDEMMDEALADGEGGDAGDAKTTNGDNVVVSADPNAAASRNRNTVVGLKEKRVANEKRTTTPYMTKYERARVLGTRALQIRYGDNTPGNLERSTAMDLASQSRGS